MNKNINLILLNNILENQISNFEPNLNMTRIAAGTCIIVNQNTMILNPISDFEPDMPIYRYMKYEHFLNFVKTGKYGIGRISRWEDPYENYLAKCQLYDRYGHRVSRITLTYYGQCWTLLEESDAMWRIYSDMHKGSSYSSDMAVRITTSARRLQKITETIKEFNIGHIGPVVYKEQSEIDKDLRELTFDTPHEYWEKVEQEFFKKRQTFEYEKEFRIILSCGGESDLVYADESADLLIDKVTFDPRLTIAEYGLCREQIIEAGFPSEKINKSRLYDFEQQAIRLTKV